MKKIVIIIVVSIILFVLYDWLAILGTFQRINGYKIESKYYIERPESTFSSLPNVPISVIQRSQDIDILYAITSFTITSIEQASNTVDLNRNDNIVLYLRESWHKEPWINGKIINIEEIQYDGSTRVRYTIDIDRSISPGETLSGLMPGDWGGIIKTDKLPINMVPVESIREVEGKSYVCLIADRVTIPHFVSMNTPYAIKLKLKEIKKIPDVYTIEKNGSSSWVPVEGITYTDSIVVRKYTAPNSETYRFKCD